MITMRVLIVSQSISVWNVISTAFHLPTVVALIFAPSGIWSRISCRRSMPISSVVSTSWLRSMRVTTKTPLGSSGSPAMYAFISGTPSTGRVPKREETLKRPPSMLMASTKPGGRSSSQPLPPISSARAGAAVASRQAKTVRTVAAVRMRRSPGAAAMPEWRRRVQGTHRPGGADSRCLALRQGGAFRDVPAPYGVEGRVTGSVGDGSGSATPRWPSMSSITAR